ncbi:MAG: hypothetical protein AAFX87_22205 [Bacteroidota bacterium]
MKKLILSITWLCLFQGISYAQLEGEWTFYPRPGLELRMIIEKKKMTTTGRDSDQSRQFSIIKKTPTRLITKNKQQGYYQVFDYRIVNDGKELKLFPYMYFETKEDMNNVLENYQAKSYDDLFEISLYSQDYMKEIEAMKSLDSITKTDLMSMLDFRTPFGKKVEDFLNDKNNQREELRSNRDIFRMFRTKMYEQLVIMGYNPYKEFEGDPFTKFDDDPDVQKALNSFDDISFDFSGN